MSTRIYYTIAIVALSGGKTKYLMDLPHISKMKLNKPSIIGLVKFAFAKPAGR